MSAKTTYTPKLGEKICRLMIEGYSLNKICKQPDMPGISTVFGWLAKESHPFSDKYVRAREIQAEIRADELLDIADDATNDFMEREAKSGKTFIVADHENIQRSRLRVDTRKWVAAKLLPKKYGDSPVRAGDERAKEAIAETISAWDRRAEDAATKLRKTDGAVGASESVNGSPAELPDRSSTEREDMGNPSKDSAVQSSG